MHHNVLAPFFETQCICDVVNLSVCLSMWQMRWHSTA